MPAPFRFLFIGGLILIAGLFIVEAFLPKEPPPKQSAPAPEMLTPRVREGAAPALELPRVDGGTFSLASYRGKRPVVLYFFATW